MPITSELVRAGVCLMVCVVAAPAAAAAEARVDYGREIRPLLADACYACHGPDADDRQADLRLDVKTGAFDELPSGSRAVVPGDAAGSELYQRLVTADIDARMPPEGQDKTLTAAQIDQIKRWIDEGAEWNEHWSFVAPVRPAVPPVHDTAWGRGAIDRFILARLEQEGLRPAAEANKVALIRRVTLDLTGLPPTPEQVDRFLADDSPTAYKRVVDRLFHSPHYGEHMARYWLDAARFADTHGLHLDNERSIWPYRDWVIAAFNANTPFDTFSIEQLAGDLLPGATQEQRIATGFNRCHVTTNEGGVIKEEFYVRNTVDRVETTATVWLGLTAGCAVCHDHKFDPLTKKEFYQLFAFFGSTAEEALDGNAKPYPPVVKLPTAAQQAQLDDLDTQIAALDNRIKQTDKAETDTKDQQIQVQLKQLQEKKKALDESIPTTMIMQELPKRRDAFDLERGEYDKRAGKVVPAVPAFLPPLPEGTSADRLGLARWLVDGAHPLTARVTVNRLWQQLFGAGIVETAEDFGAQGKWPSHPKLLDWLATELVRSDWDVQHMLRLMVTSATYRQASAVTPALLQVDPNNRLLARGPRFRLDAEAVRDTALAVSGLLVQHVGGKSVKPYQPAGIWKAVGYTSSNTANFHQDHGAALYRRSVYTFWKRTAPPPALAALDAPSRETCTVRRVRTNTPLAALVLLNDKQLVEAARCLAQRAMHEGGSDPHGRLTRAFRLATARRPDTDEVRVLLQLYAQQLADFQADPATARQLVNTGESTPDETLDPCALAAWTIVANLILNLDETVTKG